MKKCPFCAEDIATEAIKCKHCGSMLNAAKPVQGGKKAMHPFTLVPIVFGVPVAMILCGGAGQGHFGDGQRQMALMLLIGSCVISAVIYAKG